MKKNVASKILAGALASTMVLSMAACGEGEVQSSTPESSSTPQSSSSTTATPAPTAEPAFAVTVGIPCDTTHTEQNDWYDKLVGDLNEYLNADITYNFVSYNAYYDQLLLRYIAQDVDDIMVVGGGNADSNFNLACEAGLFWDLTDYIDQFDNLASIPQAVLENVSVDGHIYCIPRSRNLGRYGWGYRVDWLNNLGLEEPTTWEAFRKMCYEFTYSDPDGNGTDDTVGLYMDSWQDAWWIMATWFGVPNVWGIDANGDLIHRCQTEEFKTALKEFRDMYAEGSINNGSNGIADCFELGAGKARNTGLRTGIGGVYVQCLDDARKVQTYFEDQGITTSDEIIFTLEDYVDTGKGALVFPTAGFNGSIAISTKNIKTEEQLLKALQIVNDLSDGEAMNLIEYGWEGLTYDLDEAGYVADYDTDQLSASGVGSKSYSDGFNQIISYFTAEENARPVSRPAASTPITILEAELKASNEKYVVPNYGASYTSQTEIDNGAALDEILNNALVAYIKGEIDDNGLDEQIKTWWTAGGEAVTAEKNEKFHANK